jgi:citronellol/citronellal dehydrogenase
MRQASDRRQHRRIRVMAHRVADLARHLDASTSAAAACEGLRHDPSSISNHHSLRGYTIVITGASRGIGLAIGVAAASQGANVAIWAKSTSEDPRIPGTIYTAARQIEAAGGKAEPVECDIRSEEAVATAVERTVARFGSIDCLINNASAISPTATDATTMKRYDLMHSVNSRGTFLVTAKCLPHLKASRARGRFPHVLNISPPLDMDSRWFSPHVAYTMAKFGMSMCTLGHATEFADAGIAVNSLWPRTAIATAAVANVLGGDEMMRRSRKPEIMADAAVLVLRSDSTKCTGNFFLDDEVLKFSDLRKYAVDPSIPEEELVPDFFVPDAYAL